MHARLLDMLHDAANEHVLAIGDCVHIDFDGVAQIAVEQQRVLAQQRVDLRYGLPRITVANVGRHEGSQRRLDIVLETRRVVHDRHGAPAEHIGGADHQRKADLHGHFMRLLDAGGDAVARLAQAQLLDQQLETVAVFGEVDGVGRGAQDRHFGGLKRLGEFQGRLPAELHDDTLDAAVLAFLAHDFQHVLGCQRLEIEAVRRVVVGRDGLGIAVDHDRLIARLREGESRVTAAIVEFDALADAVRAASQDDDFLASGGVRFAGMLAEAALIGGIHIGRWRAELGRARIDALIDRMHAERLTAARDFVCRKSGESGQPLVGKAFGFQCAEQPLRFGQTHARGPGFPNRRSPGSARRTTGRSCRTDRSARDRHSAAAPGRP